MLTLKKNLLRKSPKTKRHNSFDITCKTGVLFLSKRTHIMGILNRTPDSFSDGGAFLNDDRALWRIEEMIGDGADIIDIGGESTRPGAESVSLQEEIGRVVPLIRKARSNINIPISIDTRKAAVAEEALRAGASIVNDVTALRGDPRMRHVVAKYNSPVVLMHMKGKPETMQVYPKYDDVVEEVITYLEESIEIAKDAGIPEENIIVDPGIGFGKTTMHNLSIIKGLGRLKVLRRPILIGTSRKSFVGGVLKLDIEKRLMGTAASVVASILKGANIVRVHDTKEISQVARLTDAIWQAD